MRKKPKRKKPVSKPKRNKPVSKPKFTSLTKFETPRTLGIYVKYEFKRLYPIEENDLEEIKRIVRRDFKKHVRLPYHFAIFMIELSVLGGFYQVRWGLPKDEEEKWIKQWVSTPVCSTMETLVEETEFLLDSVIEKQLQNRPCWILRFQLTFLSNVTNPPKS